MEPLITGRLPLACAKKEEEEKENFRERFLFANIEKIQLRINFAHVEYVRLREISQYWAIKLQEISFH